MAKGAFNDLIKVLTSKQITNKLKMRIIKSYVYSTLMYGSETWTMNKQLEDRISAFEMSIYRKIGRISWTEKLTNNRVLERLGIKIERVKDQTNEIFRSYKKT